VFLTTLQEAVNYFSENAPKGEYVLVIEGAKKEEIKEQYTLEDAVNLAKKLKSEGLKTADAAKEAASVTGFKKSDIYKEIL
jgi:16S rRNA (cytidine1402-2'-O)-methyltransferase